MKALLSTFVLAVSLCSPIRAQPDPAEWIVRLRDDRQRLSALQQLVAIGSDAVPGLLAEHRKCVTKQDSDGELLVLQAIACLGSQARDALSPLCDRLATIRKADRLALLRATASIGPTYDDTDRTAHETLMQTKVTPGLEWQVWSIARARLRMTAPSNEDLRSMLETEELLPVCVASMWVVDHPDCHAALREKTIDAHRTARAAQQRFGDSYLPMVEATALAVVAVAADTSDADVAWARLCRHADPIVRLEAVTALRRQPGAATEAVQALTRALQDHERPIVRETMITLGSYSDEAIEAMPALAIWLGSPDRELRQLGEATMRRIRSNMSPIPAEISELCEAGADADAAVARIIAIGQRARPHLQVMRRGSPAALQQHIDAALRGIDG